MNIRRIIAAFAAALAVLAVASIFRFELVARNESSGVYRLDRWTGAVELILGSSSEAVTGENDKPLGLVGALTPNWWDQDREAPNEEAPAKRGYVPFTGKLDEAPPAASAKEGTGDTATDWRQYTPIAPAGTPWLSLETQKKAAVAGVVGGMIGLIYGGYLVISTWIKRFRQRRVAAGGSK